MCHLDVAIGLPGYILYCFHNLKVDIERIGFGCLLYERTQLVTQLQVHREGNEKEMEMELRFHDFLKRNLSSTQTLPFHWIWFYLFQLLGLFECSTYQRRPSVPVPFQREPSSTSRFLHFAASRGTYNRAFNCFFKNVEIQFPKKRVVVDIF